MRRASGFTLVEVLVAAAVLAMLGTVLSAILLWSGETWRREAARQDAWDAANVVLTALRRDLEAAVRQSARARLSADFDIAGRQRLLMVRATGPEAQDPVLRWAGSRVGADRAVDGDSDVAEAEALDLAPTGGLAEVLWAMDPAPGSTALMRASRAPPGRWGADALMLLAQRVSDRVLYLEVNFWAPDTDTWEGDLRLESGDRGPADRWDSTRGADPEFPYFAGPASLSDPSDDVFPARAQVVLVVADRGLGDTTLAADVTDATLSLPLVRIAGFSERGWTYARVGEEWVRYDARDATGLRCAPDGRGYRGTAPSAHPRGTPVVTGRTFTMVVDCPARREAPWVR